MSIRDRVALGAALLDIKVPEWRKHVHVESLDLASTYNCVLGQLFKGGDAFSPYSTGLEFLGLASGVAHGFDRDPYDYDDYDELTDAWRDELTRAA